LFTLSKLGLTIYFKDLYITESAPLSTL